MMLVSYAAKATSKWPKKLVYIHSVMHDQPTLDENGKSDIILFYNMTKRDVDAFDQMCVTCTCRRKTQRWPLSLFYGLFDAPGINSWYIHSANIQAAAQQPLHRRAFLMHLAMDLIHPETPVNQKPVSRSCSFYHKDLVAPLDKNAQDMRNVHLLLNSSKKGEALQEVPREDNQED